MATVLLVFVVILVIAGLYENVEKLTQDNKKLKEEYEEKINKDSKEAAISREQRRRILSNTEMVIDVLKTYSDEDFLKNKKAVISQLNKGVYDAKNYGTKRES